MTTDLRLRSLLLVSFAAVALTVAAAEKAPTAPGKYKEWGPDIDEVEIIKPFKLSAYTKVVVQALDVSSTPRPDDKDMIEVVDKVLPHATEPFLEGIRKKLPEAALQNAQSADAAGVLLIRGKITTLDPGSRSKRMWVGYGAGAARTAIDGEIVDARTGEVLIRFRQERRSGIERFGRGSSYEEILKRNLNAIGQDVTNLLKTL
jgi:hypothetical protein